MTKQKIGTLVGSAILVAGAVSLVFFNHQHVTNGLGVGLDWVNGMNPETLSIILETIVGAVSVSAVGIAIKKWADIDSPKKMLAIVMFLSGAAGLLEYAHGVPAFDGIFALFQIVFTFAASQPAYRYAVLPVATRLSAKFSAWFAAKVTAAQANLDAQSAKVPQDGLVLSAVGEDFGH